MSTRRSTRAASSRASSVAASDVGATPRRSTRNKPNPDGSPLPALAPRESTSYGSGIAVLPSDIRRRGPERGLTETLTGILGTVQENLQSQYGAPPHVDDGDEPQEPETPIDNYPKKTVGRGKGRKVASNTSAAINGRARGTASSVTSTPAPENIAFIYQGESGIFGDATFHEDLAASAPESIQRQSTRAPEEIPALPAISEESRIEVAAPVPAWMKISKAFQITYVHFKTGLGKLRTHLSGSLRYVTQNTFYKWMVFIFLLLMVSASFFQPASYLSSAGHNIRQWVTFRISNPLSYLNDHAVVDLQKRMFAVENDVTWMKRDLILHKDTLKKLEAILPEKIYVTKSDGQTELPRGIWNGMTEIFGYSTFKGKTETVTHSDWEEFLAHNAANVKAWHADSPENPWSMRIRESLREWGYLVSRDEAMNLIQKRWDESQISIKQELKKELANLVEMSHQNRPRGISESEAAALSREVFSEMYKNLELKAFAQSQDSEHVSYHSLQRPNFFSFGLGAVVNPSVTSPTFDFTSKRAWILKRAILWLSGYSLPTPNPPAEALNKWDEAGECWCSPSQGPGTGVQLGVLMSHDLYPKEIVIEHIPKSATLDSKSAPQEMEVLAFIESLEKRKDVAVRSQTLFHRGPEKNLAKGWYLIGTFRYDLNWPRHIQHFYPQVDLQSLGISTRDLVVRVKSNWGNPDYTCLYRVRVYGEVADNDNATV